MKKLEWVSPHSDMMFSTPHSEKKLTYKIVRRAKDGVYHLTIKSAGGTVMLEEFFQTKIAAQIVAQDYYNVSEAENE